MCLRVLKESNKSRSDSYSRQEQCVDHIPYYLSGLSRAYFLRQPFEIAVYETNTTAYVFLRGGGRGVVSQLYSRLHVRPPLVSDCDHFLA